MNDPLQTQFFVREQFIECLETLNYIFRKVTCMCDIFAHEKELMVMNILNLISFMLCSMASKIC